MDGYYSARRVRCQGCEAVSLHIEEIGRPRQSDSLFVVDDAPEYQPDPRMMPKG